MRTGVLPKLGGGRPQSSCQKPGVNQVMRAGKPFTLWGNTITFGPHTRSIAVTILKGIPSPLPSEAAAPTPDPAGGTRPLVLFLLSRSGSRLMPNQHPPERDWRGVGLGGGVGEWGQARSYLGAFPPSIAENLFRW